MSICGNQGIQDNVNKRTLLKFKLQQKFRFNYKNLINRYLLQKYKINRNQHKF